MVAETAAYLRKADPLSPAPFLMMRGLRWGELRAAAAASNEMALEGPFPELRVRIKTLAVQHKWSELNRGSGVRVALPASRAWLDLQRLVVQACCALGAEYNPIATAICSEMRALVCDLPNLVTATLTDDTPTANPETRAWIESLMHAPAGENQSNGWRRNAGPWSLALEAFEAKNQEKAFQILHEDLERQHSGANASGVNSSNWWIYVSRPVKKPWLNRYSTISRRHWRNITWRTGKIRNSSPKRC